MLALAPSLILFVAAAVLVTLRFARPSFRYLWLISIGAGLFALAGVMAWQPVLPLLIRMPGWQPGQFDVEPLAFGMDGLLWPLGMSVCVLNLAVLLTSGKHDGEPDLLTWSGSLVLSGLALLAVTAATPITLVLVWTAFDLIQFTAQLLSGQGPSGSDSAVAGLASRLFGTGLLVGTTLSARVPGAEGSVESFAGPVGAALIAAVAFRLGPFSLHPSATMDPARRRGLGTALRLTSAVSSLVVAARVPLGSGPIAQIVVLILVAMAGLAAGWYWLMADNAVIGRPYWVVAVSALAVASAINGSPEATVAWSAAMLLAGAALFLRSGEGIGWRPVLLAGAWGISTLPFSLTAVAWERPPFTAVPFLPALLAIQALIATGYIRKALQAAKDTPPAATTAWTRRAEQVGMALSVSSLLLLGLWGWQGAFRPGGVLLSLVSAVLMLGLFWVTGRSHTLKLRAEWLSRIIRTLQQQSVVVWGLLRGLGGPTSAITTTLEGAGGVMWSLLFLVLIISLLAQSTP